MKTKVSHFEVKADETSEGVFVGYAAIFDNVDSYGDVIRKGAFADSVKSFSENGAGIPCYWSHQMSSDPHLNLGVTTAAEEDERGLKVTVELDVKDNPTAAYAHKLLKTGRVGSMSFAYDVLEGSASKADDGSDYYELRKLKIHEVSVVPVGANQETEILEVKSFDPTTELLDVKDRVTHVKAGRKVSAANEEKLSEAISLIEQVLKDSTSEEDDGNPPPSEDPSTDESKDGGEKSRTFDPDAALANLFITTEGA